MHEFKHFTTEFLLDLENKKKDLDLERDGFKFVRDADKEQLDDNTIYNVIIKSNLHRGIELKKKWVTVSVSEKNGELFLLSYDKRLNEDEPIIMRVNPKTDKSIYSQMDAFYNNNMQEQIKKEQEKADIKEALKQILITNFSHKGVTRETLFEDEDINKVYSKIDTPFTISLDISREPRSNGKYSSKLRVDAENQETYYITRMNVENISELPEEVKKRVKDLDEAVKIAFLKNTPEVLLTKEKKSFKPEFKEPKLQKQILNNTPKSSTNDLESSIKSKELDIEIIKEQQELLKLKIEAQKLGIM